MGCIACWVISWDVFHVGSLVVDVFHFGSLVVDVFHFGSLVVSVFHVGSLVELYSMLNHWLCCLSLLVIGYWFIPCLVIGNPG